jgi:hypothetical protein
VQQSTLDLSYARRVMHTALDRCGAAVEIGHDLGRWADFIRSRDAYVFAALDPRCRRHDGAPGYAILRAGIEGQVLGTMAWHVDYTADFVEEMESGRLYYGNDPAKLTQFGRHVTGLSGWLRIAGLTAVRGGLHSWGDHQAVGWWLALAAHIECLEAGASWTVGQSFESVAWGNLPFRWGGYTGSQRMRAYKFPHLDRPVEFTFWWSPREHMAKAVRLRTAYLSAADHEDLGTAVRSYERVHPADYEATCGIPATRLARATVNDGELRHTA